MDSVVKTADKPEANTLELLENAKKALNTNDFKSAQYYVNLAMFSQSNDIAAKITAFSILSQVFMKSKNNDLLFKIARKVMTYLDKIPLKTIPTEIVISFVKILLKAGQVSDELNQNIIASWFFFLSKNIQRDYSLKSDEIYEVLRTTSPKVLKKLNESFILAQAAIKDQRTNLKRFSEQVLKFCATPLTIDKERESFFLVNTRWLTHMHNFIRHLNDPKIDVKDLFTVNDMCLLYFSKDDEEEDVKDLQGLFCGPINNFLLVKGTDSWIDPVDTFTNTYISSDIQDKTSFYYFTEDIYGQLKFYFNSIDDIERKSIKTKDDKFEIELHLKKVNLIFINDFLRENLKEEIKPKKFQISKNATLSEFIQKIERIFKHLLSINMCDEEEFYYKIYLAEKNDKEIFEMILSYVNRNKTHKITAKEIVITGDIKTVDELKFSKSSIIIVEALSKCCIVKPFLKIISEKSNCSVCNLQVEKDKLILCNSCTQNVYCSEVCKKKDSAHVEYHNRISSLYKKKLNLEEMEKLNISALLDTNSKGGLVGLKNLGNTCFLNSGIQCLSHCPDLSKYFLTNSHLDDFGKGGEGIVAKVYANLLKELWMGFSPFLTPLDFKTVFFGFVKQFAGVTHQDSYEMILFMLDRLNDDLNKVKNKPTLEFYEAMKGESDLEASQRWWNTHTARNQSIIVDLFHGQYKTKIRCPDCKRVSIAFDPFNVISLAIPDRTQYTKIRFKVFPNNFDYKYFYIDCYDVNKFTSIKDLKNKVKERQAYVKCEFDALLFKNRELVSVLGDDELIYDYVFTRVDFSDEEFIEYEITLAQVEQSFMNKNKGDYVTFFVSPSSLNNESYYYLFNYKVPVSLTYAKAFSIHKKSTVKDLYQEVFKYYRRAMDDMLKPNDDGEMDTSYYNTFYENLNDKDFIEGEFNQAFQGDQKEKLFELYFQNNIPGSNSWIYGKPACEYCQNRKCTFCRLSLPLETSIYELYVMQTIPREFLIIADFSRFREMFTRFYEEFLDYTDPKNSLRGDLTIYDCIDVSKKEEKFTKDNLWQCTKCEKSVEAFKKVELYKAPIYLIFHFKRFKLKGFTDLMEMVNNKKNETFVDFPLDNLDIGTYIIGPNKSGYTYELVAINQHFGTLKQGHYVAVCKNNNEWYEFNDDIVKKVDDVNSIINENAYMLFYRRKDYKTDTKTSGVPTAITSKDNSTSINSVMGESNDL